MKPKILVVLIVILSAFSSVHANLEDPWGQIIYQFEINENSGCVGNYNYSTGGNTSVSGTPVWYSDDTDYMIDTEAGKCIDSTPPTISGDICSDFAFTWRALVASSTASLDCLLCFDSDTSVNDEVNFFYDTAGRYFILRNGGSTKFEYDGGVGYFKDKDVHGVINRKGSNITFWINGTIVNESTYSGCLGIGTVEGVGLAGLTGSGAYDLPANISYVHILNRSLNYSEILSLRDNYTLDSIPGSVEILNLTILNPVNNTNTTNATIDIRTQVDSNSSYYHYRVFRNDSLILNTSTSSKFYNFSNGASFTNDGLYKITFHVTDNNSNTDNESVWIRIDRTPPNNVSLELPTDLDHTSVNKTVFNWSDMVDLGIGVQSYTLQVSNSSDFSTLEFNITSIGTSHYTLINPLNDGIKYWRIIYNDTLGNQNTSDYFNVTIDTIFPDWIQGTTFKFDNSTKVGINFTLDCSVFDTNLFRTNYSIINGTFGNITLHSTYIADHNVSTWNCNTVTVDTTGWTDLMNYTVELSATDDHTYGNIGGITVQETSDGLILEDGYTKRIYLGYYLNGEFNILTPQQHFNYNVQWQIGQPIHGEIKYNLTFNKPSQDVKFGFGISKHNIQLVDSTKGHFVWNHKNGYYLDFEDLVETGFPISYKEIGDYYVIYSDTKYCQVEVGETCVFDPVVGGLNTRTEYYNIFYNESVGVSTPTTSNIDFSNVSSIIQGMSAVVLAFIPVALWSLIFVLFGILLVLIKELLDNITRKVEGGRNQ